MSCNVLRFQHSKLEDCAKNLRDQIEESIHNPDSDAAFMAEKDLNRVLNQEAIAKLLQCPLNDGIVQQVESKHRKVLAILVYCSAPNSRSILQNAIKTWRDDANSSSLPTDEELPLEKLRAVATFGHHGYIDQNIFRAIILQKGRQNDDTRGDRLPFIGMRKEIGRGSAGAVYKVKIAPGHWLTEGGKTYDQPLELAQKVYDREEENARNVEAFEREMKIMEKLEKCPHSHIALHVASLVQGSLKSVFTKLAKGTLHTLFWGPDELDNGQRQWDSTPVAEISKNSIDIAGALSWMHQYGVYHLDIRPENILIYEKGRGDIWKLADFDRSVAKEGLPHRSSRHPKYEYSSVSVRQESATYRAPEVFTDGQAGKESDVWSMGCMLALTMSYRHKRRESVNTFAERRSRVIKAFGGEEGVTVDYFHADNIQTETREVLYSKVTPRFEELKIDARAIDHCEGDYVGKVLDYIVDKVFIRKELRTSAEDLYQEMRHLLDEYQTKQRALDVEDQEKRKILNKATPNFALTYFSPDFGPSSLSPDFAKGLSLPNGEYKNDEPTLNDNKCTAYCELIRKQDFGRLKELVENPMRPNINGLCKLCNRAPLHLALEIWGEENDTQVRILYKLLEKDADPTLLFPFGKSPFIYICTKGYIKPAKIIAWAILKDSEIPFDEAQFNSLKLDRDFRNEMKHHIEVLKDANRDVVQIGRPRSLLGTLHIEEAQDTVERDSDNPVRSERKSRLRNLLKRVIRER